MIMRRPHIISSFATASSLVASSRRVAVYHGLRCQLSKAEAAAAFMQRSAIKRRFSSTQHHHTHLPILSNKDMTGARHFGSKSMNFRQQFSRTNAKTSQGDANINHEENIGEDSISLKSEEEEEAYQHQYEPSYDVVKDKSLEWIEKVVIGYNLCPFAERPLREDKLRVSVVRGNDDEFVAGAVAYELIARSDENQPGTTVVVAPEYHPDDFNKYMSLVQYIEDEVIDEYDLDGIVQLAPFHPLFEFAGSGSDGVDNYTNRSPYPMFHILREDEVGSAVDKLGGDASKVWSRNVKLLESMEKRFGREGVEKAMRGEEVDGMADLLKEVKLSGYCDNDKDKEQ